MTAFMTGNWINVRRGDHAFLVSTNVCDYFEVGARNGDDFWLEGDIVAKEFIFNGRLFVPGAQTNGTIIDNFPKGPAPKGWTKHQAVDGEGYDLRSEDDKVLFGYRVQDHICKVTVNIYSKRGDLVAESTPGAFQLHGRPLRLGRSGIVFG